MQKYPGIINITQTLILNRIAGDGAQLAVKRAIFCKGKRIQLHFNLLPHAHKTLVLVQNLDICDDGDIVRHQHHQRLGRLHHAANGLHGQLLNRTTDRCAQLAQIGPLFGFPKGEVRLFELSPEVRPMFRSDMDEQGRKLMVTLGVVANGLNNLDRIVPVAEELARRHVPLGVQPDHYGPVGQALIDTLEKGLGAEFTAEARAAWTEAYGLLSGVMIAAAYPDEESAT